jgi:hypothetical protein
VESPDLTNVSSLMYNAFTFYVGFNNEAVYACRGLSGGNLSPFIDGSMYRQITDFAVDTFRPVLNVGRSGVIAVAVLISESPWLLSLFRTYDNGETWETVLDAFDIFQDLTSTRSIVFNERTYMVGFDGVGISCVVYSKDYQQVPFPNGALSSKVAATAYDVECGFVKDARSALYVDVSINEEGGFDRYKSEDLGYTWVKIITGA